MCDEQDTEQVMAKVPVGKIKIHIEHIKKVIDIKVMKKSYKKKNIE